MTKIPTEVLLLAQKGGWDVSPYKDEGWKLVTAAILERHWQSVALDREFWLGIRKAKKFDQPIWHCKSWDIMCVVDGKKTDERRCGNEFCSYEGWKDFDPGSQYGEVHNFLHLVLSGQDPTEWWNELLANK